MSNAKNNLTAAGRLAGRLAKVDEREETTIQNARTLATESREALRKLAGPEVCALVDAASGASPGGAPGTGASGNNMGYGAG